jgi:hypothetical protein
LQQPTASFAAKAAIDRNSDEDPMASTTISHNTDHQQQQQQQQQQPGAGSGAAANAAGWLPHDVRMVMRKHAYSYPAAYLEAISPKHLPPNKVRLELAATVHGASQPNVWHLPAVHSVGTNMCRKGRTTRSGC